VRNNQEWHNLRSERQINETQGARAQAQGRQNEFPLPLACGLIPHASHSPPGCKKA